MAGMLSVRADIDLNSYSMLTLNHDNTVTFINPQISFSVTKLESIVALPGYGADWALSKNKDFLYLTLPHQSADDLLLRRRDDGPDGDISELQAETSRIAGDRPKPRRDRAGRVLASDQAQGGGHI
jgi:hypothetical protein